MKALPQRRMEFGWPGDGGVGERLVDQIISGRKTATCGFKAAYTLAELDEVLCGSGELWAACATGGEPRCIIRVSEVFETTFGAPDPRLVAGEGDGEDVSKFQEDHRIAWWSTFPGSDPLPEEILVVEMFELVEVL